MSKKISQTHSTMTGRRVRQFSMTQVTDSAVLNLAKIGLFFDRSTVEDQMLALNRAGAFRSTKDGAMDSAFTAPITTASIPTPIQFLQNWLPGFVKVMTAARKIDDIVGIKTVGNWEDQEIVQGIVEPAGTATEYGDYTNIPLQSWNANFERRTIVRGEMGIAVGLLEEGRASAMRLNSAEEKRQGAAVSLEIFRNAVGFYGWNSGSNRTFGLLNDPNLLPPITLPSGGWNGADFKAITLDIRTMVRTLRTQSQDNVDPEKVEITFALPTDKVDLLTQTTDFGVSVRDWLTQTYPKIRVVSAPELMDGETGDAIAYMFAEDIESSVDGSTDGGEVFAQLVQSKFITTGVEKRAKSYVEDYTNGTAGVLCKRPWACVRAIGI